MDHKEMLTSLRSAFQVEAADLLNEVDSSLLQLEANPDGEIIHRVFRAIHTLKGSGAMVGLERLSRFAHRVEEVFEAARDGELRVTPELTDLALRACDLLRVFLADADSTPDLESGTEQQLVTALKAFVKPETQAAPAVQAAGPAVAALGVRSAADCSGFHVCRSPASVFLARRVSATNASSTDLHPAGAGNSKRPFARP